MGIFDLIVGGTTIAGFIFTAIQVYKTRSAAEAAEHASLETTKRVSASFLLPDITRLIQRARFAKDNAFLGQYEAARIRLQDVSDGINEFKGCLKGDLRTFNKATEKITLCIRALEACQFEEKTLNSQVFSSDIEALIEQLNNIQRVVKTQMV